MEDLVVYTHVAPATELRLWVGVRQAIAAPLLLFELDGTTVPAKVVRPLTPVGATPCAYTGVFTLDGLQPDRVYIVTVRSSSGAVATRRTRTLPAGLANGESLRVLLVSCYHRDEDPRIPLLTFPNLLAPAERPHLTLFMGDQVYLDLPTEKDYPSDAPHLARVLESKYDQNWFGSDGIGVLLRMAPFLCTPDDHEFWNNFPDRATVVQNTWTENGRKTWKQTAARLFAAYQLSGDAAPTAPRKIDIGPISIFVLDTRSDRHPDHARCCTPAALQALETWASNLKPSQLGLLVTGQPLLQGAASWFDGNVADWALANYEGDYRRIAMAARGAALRAGGFLLLTGDVHWGRLTRVHDRHGRTLLHEIISSPTSLVTTLISDDIVGFFKKLGGSDWPRHPGADDPPAFFADKALGKIYGTEMRHGQPGDQVAMLEITPVAGGFRTKVTFYPLHWPLMPPVPVHFSVRP